MGNNLLMQTKLGHTHDTIKEFGSKGTPLKEAFWKQIKKERVNKHINFLFEEKYGNKFGKLTNEILKEQYSNAYKKLIKRGYRIL